MSFGHNDENENILKGIRCPECGQNQRFAIQVTQNVVIEDDGQDVMGHQPDGDDYFSERPVRQDSGWSDNDPIGCRGRNHCRHIGIVKDFRE